MGAVAETQLPGSVAADIEDVGLIPFQFVTVSRGVDHQDTCPSRDRDATNYSLPKRFSRERAYR
jgi:hypothetical protein